MTTANFMQIRPKLTFFDISFYFFPHFSSSSSRKLPICSFHKHSGLILYQFLLFLNLLENSKISDGRSNDVILHHIASQPGTSSVLANQCKFNSLCLNTTKAQGGPLTPPPPPVSRWEHWGTSYSYDPNMGMNGHSS